MTAPPGRSRYFLPLGYLLLGVAWIVSTTFLLGVADAPDLPARLLAASKYVALVAAAITILFVLQARSDPDRPAGEWSARLTSGLFRPYMVFAVTALAVLLAGVLLYQQQFAEVSHRSQDALANLTDLTGQQVEEWLGECRTDLEFAGRNPLLAYAIEHRRTIQSDTTRPDMKGGLDVLRQGEGFERVQVFAPDGSPIEHSGGRIELTEPLRFWIRGATQTGRVVMSDLYVPADSVDGRPAIDFVVSVMHADRPHEAVGVLVARVDPDQQLFTTLLHHNSTLKSLSFTIAHRRGDTAAVLLPPALRTTSMYEIESTVPDAPALQVLRGRRGVFTAHDAEGHPLFATGREIAQTPWFLVATVPEEGLFAPLRRAAHLALLLAAAALVLSGFLVDRWWRSERRAMAEQVAAAERRTTLVKEHFAIAGRFVQDIVLLLDERDGTILEANDRALEAYGYERTELLARTIFNLKPAGSDEERAAHERFDAMRKSGGGTYVTRHWRKDGQSFPVEASMRFCELDGRRFVQMVGRDVTLRVEQELRLAQVSAERDRLLDRMQRQFNQMAIACIVLAADGTVLQSNPAVERVFGYRPQDVVGCNVSKFIRSQSFLELVNHWLDHLRANPDATLGGVFDNFDASNRPITCRWTATALRDEHGQFGGLIGMAEDITEQMAAERALRHSEERYRALTDISPVGVFRTDLAGEIVFVNSRFEQTFGMNASECLGRGWARAVHPDDARATVGDWKEYLDSRGTRLHRPEFRVARPDGSIVWVLAQVAPERDLQGHVQGHIGTITDITLLKHAEIALRQARDHLEERVAARTLELESAKNAAEHSDRVKSAFLSTMSHELRTPLNSILGFTDVLLQGLSGPLNDAQQRQLRIVRESSTHLRSLIEDVLDISRIEAGQIGLEFTEVDLYELVMRRVEAFGPEYARKGIELRIEAEGTLPVVRSDRKRTAQIVNNLLSNSLKFTDQGSVTVRLRKVADRLEIEVADTGIGIPTHAQATLFNPFTQVIRPGGRMHEGTGLGLAISRNLARALGGDITVASEPGRGSRFAFWLPLIAQERDVASASGTFRQVDARRALGAV